MFLWCLFFPLTQKNGATETCPWCRPIAVPTPTVGDGRRTVGTTDMPCSEKYASGRDFAAVAHKRYEHQKYAVFSSKNAHTRTCTRQSPIDRRLRGLFIVRTPPVQSAPWACVFSVRCNTHAHYPLLVTPRTHTYTCAHHAFLLGSAARLHCVPLLGSAARLQADQRLHYRVQRSSSATEACP